MLRVVDHPLVEHKLALLRDAGTRPELFRELLEEITFLLLFEATRDLKLEERVIITPMGQAAGQVLVEEAAFVPILRAGLGMVEPALKMIPGAQVWHLGIYRDEKTLEPVVYRVPEHGSVQVAFILDPMLATGGSAVVAVEILKRAGVGRIRFVGVIAAPEGIARLFGIHPDVDVYVAALDDHLNEFGYIVPGLGDAGDRQFGT